MAELCIYLNLVCIISCLMTFRYYCGIHFRQVSLLLRKEPGRELSCLLSTTHLSFGQQSSGQTYQLPLTHREVAPSLGNISLQSSKSLYNVLQVTPFKDIPKVMVRVAECRVKVFTHGATEEEWVLWNDSQSRSGVEYNNTNVMLSITE